MNPEYPIYIISKLRWSILKTTKTLDKMRVPWRIVVEPTEYENYAKHVDKEKILQLPFSNLGQGSIPARNWVWEHAITEGWKRHWILDDNINAFWRLNNNLKIPVETGTIFKCAEDFVERYTNIALAGFNYDYFCAASQKYPPYYLNTRIYSCILIKNDIPFRWRGRYKEDTDLSIRVLKAGWCTILRNAFLACKEPTLKMKGGNTDTIYNTGDKRYAFAKSLKDQHPDITKIVWRYNRWHHDVDYSKFQKNKLIRKDNQEIPEGINEYGMKLIDLRKEKRKRYIKKTS